MSVVCYLGDVYSSSEADFDGNPIINLHLRPNPPSIYDAILSSLSPLPFQMDGKLSFVESFKKTMNLLPSQKVTKGISALDVNLYLRWLKSNLSTRNINVEYV